MLHYIIKFWCNAMSLEEIIFSCTYETATRKIGTIGSQDYQYIHLQTGVLEVCENLASGSGS